SLHGIHALQRGCFGANSPSPTTMPTSSIPDTKDSTWMDGLADFLAQERGVEAILLNQDERKVSIATLGNVNTDALHAKLDTLLRALDAQFGTTGLSHAAIAPPGDFPLNVRAMPGEDGLIEKPSCPTAPRFWKW